jgi:hypothetical protein
VEIHPYKDTSYVFLTKGRESEQLGSLQAFLTAIMTRNVYDSRLGPQANDDGVV